MKKLFDIVAYIAIAIVIASVIFNSLRIGGNNAKIGDLKKQIACLKHPHAESSIAGKLVGTGKHRHFVLTQPAHKTDC